MTISDTLAAADWPRRPALLQLAKAMGPGNLRWVGGAVRDTLLGLDVRDVDAATPLPPETVMEILARANIRTVPTGLDHGTITALIDGGNVEITTLRHDLSTDGRRATVKYASDWRDDAARRDFTINALYADPFTLELFDYFGGCTDLAARRVRFIGDAQQRIREDHLRILRFFRFQARFAAQPDAEAEAACTQLRDTLKGLSRERVAMELLNLLSLPNPAPTAARMHKLGVLQVVLPEAGKRELVALAALVGAENKAGIASDPLRRMAALLPPIASVAESVSVRLRLSRKQRKRLSCNAERQPSDKDAPRILAYRETLECAIDRLLLGGFDISRLQGWDVPQLPLKGGEIVARGVVAGPEIARILRAVEDRWVVEGFPDSARTSAILDAILKDPLSKKI